MSFVEEAKCVKGLNNGYFKTVFYQSNNDLISLILYLLGMLQGGELDEDRGSLKEA